MRYYNMEVKEVLLALESSEIGLAEEEISLRNNKDGLNVLTEERKISNVTKFFNQFKDLMIIILLISSVISFVISIMNNESFIDSIIIIMIVIINAVLGFIQEAKADKAIESLKSMQTKSVKVKRNNTITIIDSKDIVRGDIIVLEAGDTVPADARLIWEASLKVDESTLTGESLPVEKSIKKIDEDVSLSQRANMIYSGTNVVYGKALAVVTEIGMQTEIGMIASSLSETEKEVTPLQIKINEISKFLTIIIGIIIVVMFIVGLIRGMELTEIIMLSISLAVAAIPEGLPAVITIILSLGMSELARKKAIVRKMSSVETLGCTEIICSDKTGTITQNKMKVMEVYFDNKLYVDEELNDSILIDMMILNNDVSKDGEKYIGDPTEAALYNYCENKLDVDKFINEHQRIGEIPFDSDRKMMSTINDYDSIKKIYTKGSFDSLINCCTRVFEDNKIVNLTDNKKNELKKIERNESSKAYRVIAFAYKDLDDNIDVDSELESDLIFAGMVCMIDPAREDVKGSIRMCKSANIRPIMITGDSLETATAIARDIGILEDESEAILGIDLDKYSSDELKEVVKKYSVYARVSPTNKLSIVNAWKDNNRVVAMTGDGVNDAPALKSANIGVGMGITGTEVSKGVSDIILSDDSFSTIVTAVKEGRRIYDNIRNVIVYLLTSNICEILVVFIGMLFGISIYSPIQLLYINLITDSIPAIALAFEKEDKEIMNRDVRKKDASFFTPFLISKITISAILKTIAVLGIYFYFNNVYGVNVATTTSFLSLIILEMIFALSCRNLKKNIFEVNLFGNKVMNKSMLLLVIIQIVVFITPIRSLFKIELLSVTQVLYCLIVCLVIFLIDEIFKSVIRKKIRD